jgi:DNA-directed RNA polymerase specialized sigma24 family protein
MGDSPAQKLDYKKDWSLTPPSFQRLLRWLDEGASSNGQKYLEMQRRLVAYFDRKNCSAPDELADETLNRVARRLEEENITDSETPAAKYCYIVARFVFMEYLRGAQKEQVLADESRRQLYRNKPAVQSLDIERETRENMLTCLDRCTGKLDSLNRNIILRYYTGKERVKIESRRALAVSLGISMNALSIRACRIRDKIEMCVRQCVGPE